MGKKVSEFMILKDDAAAKAHRKAPMGYEMMFIVPNDAEGQLFLKMFRTFLRTGDFKAKYRGKHPQRKKMCAIAGVYYNTNHEIPVRLAKYIAVYVEKKNHVREASRKKFADMSKMEGTA